MSSFIRFLPRLAVASLTCASALYGNAQEPIDERSAPTVLEARAILDSVSCPIAIEVWLLETHDTVPALELYLTWDRPDFARFQTQRSRGSVHDSLFKDAQKHGDTSSSAFNRPSVTPALQREGGLLQDWEYFEARGEGGVSVKVVAFANLVGERAARPLYPADSGLLFALPVNVPFDHYRQVDNDSAVVRLEPTQTRLSDNRGQLLEKVVLRNSVVHIPACWESRGEP